jgi:CcmD family protein
MNDSTKLIAVVLVSSLIAIGLFIYLISIDRKLSRLEKELKNNK